MLRASMKRFGFITASLVLLRWSVSAQAPVTTGRPPSQQNNEQSDTLTQKHRVNPWVIVTYRQLTDTRDQKPDSTFTDFYNNYPVPADEVYLGNIGTAAYPIIYKPSLEAGWDPGIHVLDPYRYFADSTRFYHTSSPFTELGYLVGGKQEQIIQVLHTQNPTENFNIAFEFRKINSQGYFKNQSTDANSYRISAHYNTPNIRYNLFFVFAGDKLNSGENGGIANDTFLTSKIYTDRQTVPVNLGGDSLSQFSLFNSSAIPTKSYQVDGGVLIRQSYDWGKSDTVHLNDTTDQYLFYPIFRIEQTFRFQQQVMGFSDTIPENGYYLSRYGLEGASFEPLDAVQKWNQVSADFSLMTFPVPTNQSQFIRAGITLESIKGYFIYNSTTISNLIGHFEYRNKTRNQKWDIDLNGKLYLSGTDFGNYKVSANLGRLISPAIGNINLAFVNVNEAPPFEYRFFEANRFLAFNNNLKNENTTMLQFSSGSDKWWYHLEVNYYLFGNYCYFRNYVQSAEDPSVFSLMQIILQKQFRLGHFNWYTDIAWQQTMANAPLHVPLVWARERMAWQGGLFGGHLGLAAGLDFRYNTPYEADDYSPVLQQFVVQQAVRIANVPNLGAYVNLRIRKFTGFVTTENLNTFFHSNNYAAPLYPYDGFNFKVGIRWDYIN
jgi:hypothetical protein